MHDPKKTKTDRDESSRESSTGRAFEDLVGSLFTLDVPVLTEDETEDESE